MKRAPLLIVLACLGGCGGGRPPAISEPEPGRPVVRGAENGVEMWWWVLSEDHAPVVPLLLPYVDRAPPLALEQLEVLRRGGFRVVSVPLAELDGLQARLPTIGAVQRQWLGQLPEWTDVVSGPPRLERMTVDVGDGLLALAPGRLRLLMRSWIVPEPGGADTSWPAGVVRIEMAPQHLERQARAGLAAGRVPPVEQGLVLSRFAVSFTMRGGEAILLVPEAAGAEWGAPEAEPARAALGPVGPAGPPAAAPPTIGEALLATEKDARTGARTRAIIVLIARAPERFELTGVTP